VQLARVDVKQIYLLELKKRLYHWVISFLTGEHQVADVVFMIVMVPFES
jgi:hypothetical protein